MCTVPCATVLGKCAENPEDFVPDTAQQAEHMRRLPAMCSKGACFLLDTAESWRTVLLRCSADAFHAFVDGLLNGAIDGF